MIVAVSFSGQFHLNALSKHLSDSGRPTRESVSARPMVSWIIVDKFI